MERLVEKKAKKKKWKKRNINLKKMEGGGGETQAEYSGHWDGSKLPDSMASALYFLKYFFLFFVLYFTFSIFLSLSLSLLYLRNPQVLCCSLLSIVR